MCCCGVVGGGEIVQDGWMGRCEKSKFDLPVHGDVRNGNNGRRRKRRRGVLSFFCGGKGLSLFVHTSCSRQCYPFFTRNFAQCLCVCVCGLCGLYTRILGGRMILFLFSSFVCLLLSHAQNFLRFEVTFLSRWNAREHPCLSRVYPCMDFE